MHVTKFLLHWLCKFSNVLVHLHGDIAKNGLQSIASSYLDVGKHLRKEKKFQCTVG